MLCLSSHYWGWAETLKWYCRLGCLLASRCLRKTQQHNFTSAEGMGHLLRLYQENSQAFLSCSVSSCQSFFILSLNAIHSSACSCGGMTSHRFSMPASIGLETAWAGAVEWRFCCFGAAKPDIRVSEGFAKTSTVVAWRFWCCCWIWASKAHRGIRDWIGLLSEERIESPPRMKLELGVARGKERNIL